MISLGIDTSNYTTSVAVVEDGHILLDNRQLLKVKEGELGLRQSEALYQHWENLPRLLDKAFDYKLDNIVVSVKPRPQNGSYMPCFNAGNNIGHIIGKALNIPVFELSHQHGHMMAAAYGNNLDYSKPCVFAHLSGGTLELVDEEFNIIGATKDISYGQLIDRTGQFLGLPFPSGKYIDQMALSVKACDNPLSKIHVEDKFVNLSGIENQIKKLSLSPEEISYCVMERISESFVQIISNTNATQVLVAGGVASSLFLRQYCQKYNYKFGKPELCSDNAVGLALSGGKFLWE